MNVKKAANEYETINVLFTFQKKDVDFQKHLKGNKKQKEKSNKTR